MQDSTCAAPECTSPRQTRDWCKIHYGRLLRAGDIQRLHRPSFPERFWAKVEKTVTCWNWSASKDADGYGHFLVKRNGKSYSDVAHRVAFELTNGPIPPDMRIDHTCHNRACVNPAHLRLTTHKQNLENRAGAQRNNLTSGVRGVHWYARGRKWRACVRHNKVDYHLGYFDDLAEAEAVVVAKRNELFTHNDLDRVRLIA